MQDSYSLSEICGLISETLENSFPQEYRVRAEISSLSARGGHCYMELVEKSSDSSILSAKVRAVCWSNIWNMLSAYFLQETGQTLSVGMQILVDAQINFHAVYGLSLQIVGIDPAYTLGEFAGQRKKTIERLEKDGMMQMQQMLSIPVLPKHIAVVSSCDAAGYGDFIHQLQISGYSIHTTLFAAMMQGDRAAESIMTSLEKIYDEIDNFDAVIIIRGGGATTDLSCFDNYELALHIAQFPLPIITGIGHQRDLSVADMVAYRSVKTPTAAAEFLIGFYQIQQERLLILRNRLLSIAEKRSAVQFAKLEMTKLRILKIGQNFLQSERNKLAMAERTFALLSPESIYRKGYSLVRSNGKIIKSVQSVSKGDILTTEWIDGTLKSQVI